MLHAINNNLNNRKSEKFGYGAKEKRENVISVFIMFPVAPIIGFFVCDVYDLLRDSKGEPKKKQPTSPQRKMRHNLASFFGPLIKSEYSKC